MDNVENNEVVSDLDERASQIFSDFMVRITKFEELVSVGSRFLGGFHQHLELLRKRPLQISEVVDGVLKANQTTRVKAYVKSGCINVNDGVQSVIKLNECQIGFQEHISRAKELLYEVECLMDAVLKVLHSVSETTFKYEVKHPTDGLVAHQAKLEKEEMESVYPRKPSVSDYATMMGSMYIMLKQDYIMQEKIISSLELYPSSEELESYSLMWTLRPYIKDEIIHEAWRYIR
ncbi:hypothetical protein BVC80_8723g22 [Macleaya cordata]|uniref:DUF7795 domain-containing protein n=1 Tax=Macleaya cordata TaxID=56857 RepID=A0A200Q8V9_MACCD|nr:hypothetical protein BVC80_8723g22 [Macleaya cordata]